MLANFINKTGVVTCTMLVNFINKTRVVTLKMLANFINKTRVVTLKTLANFINKWTPTKKHLFVNFLNKPAKIPLRLNTVRIADTALFPAMDHLEGAFEALSFSIISTLLTLDFDSSLLPAIASEPPELLDTAGASCLVTIILL